MSQAPYGFFDSINSDRTYNAQDFGNLFDTVISDGVIKGYGTEFAVTPASAMNVNVGSGRAWFNEKWYVSDATQLKGFGASNGSNPRIDTVALTVDKTNRQIYITTVAGTPAASPVAPTLASSDNLIQYALANVLIPAGSTSISANNITDMVGTNATPYAQNRLPVQSIDSALQTKTYSSADGMNITSVLAAEYGGSFRVQVRNGIFWMGGVFQITTAMTTSSGNDTQILSWSGTLANVFANIVDNTYGVFQQSNSTNSGMLRINKSGVYLTYRSSNPGVGYFRILVNGILA